MLTLSLIKVTYKTATVLILLEHSLLYHIISLFHTIKKSIGKHCHVWLEHLFVFAEGQKLDNVSRTHLALASGRLVQQTKFNVQDTCRKSFGFFNDENKEEILRDLILS